jgi:hypothetical protein
LFRPQGFGFDIGVDMMVNRRTLSRSSVTRQQEAMSRHYLRTSQSGSRRDTGVKHLGRTLQHFKSTEVKVFAPELAGVMLCHCHRCFEQMLIAEAERVSLRNEGRVVAVVVVPSLSRTTSCAKHLLGKEQAA